MADGLGLGGLLGQQDKVDAGQQLAELLVVPDGQLEVPGDDPGLLVVPGAVAGQLQDLGGQVLQGWRRGRRRRPSWWPSLELL